MAYETVVALREDSTIALGGRNAKTGELNPTQIEGFYLGRKERPDNKKKSGFSFIYRFKTEKGIVGVYDKTDINAQMELAVVGRMTLLKFTGMRPTKNGPMYVFSVQQDPLNTIEVAQPPVSKNTMAKYEDDTYEDEVQDVDNAAALDAQLAANAAARTRANALLNKGKIR